MRVMRVIAEALLLLYRRDLGWRVRLAVFFFSGLGWLTLAAVIGTFLLYMPQLPSEYIRTVLLWLMITLFLMGAFGLFVPQLHVGWVILAVVIVALLWYVPQLQGEYFSQNVPAKERPALVNEYRRTWAQIIGGFGLLLGLYFTWRRIEISQQELEATRDQQVTERFTRAIDQLGKTDDQGNKPLEIRLGGIYALERIARESEEDYWPIMEVLTAYVRQHARWLPEQRQEDVEGAAVERKSEKDSRGDPDILAIMTVLRRRKHTHQKEPEDLDLHGTNLSGARLYGAVLWGANLSGVNLSGANLRGAKLGYADLSGARLWKVSFGGASLRGADLSRANLIQEQLEEAEGDDNTQLPPDLERPARWTQLPPDFRPSAVRDETEEFVSRQSRRTDRG